MIVFVLQDLIEDEGIQEILTNYFPDLDISFVKDVDLETITETLAEYQVKSRSKFLLFSIKLPFSPRTTGEKHHGLI